MEEEKQKSPLYLMAKEYALWEHAEVKAYLKNKKGDAWMAENWATFNKCRNSIRARPPSDLKEAIKEIKDEKNAGVLKKGERVDDIENVTEILGRKVASASEKFVGLTKHVSMMSERVEGLKKTAEQRVEQLEDDVKQLKKELQEEREARTALEKRFSDLEEVIRKRDSKAAGKRV